MIISGTITDANAALRDCGALRVEVWIRQRFRRRMVAQAETDEQGRFSFLFKEPGRLRRDMYMYVKVFAGDEELPIEGEPRWRSTELPREMRLIVL